VLLATQTGYDPGAKYANAARAPRPRVSAQPQPPGEAEADLEETLIEAVTAAPNSLISPKFAAFGQKHFRATAGLISLGYG
jgi:hypothetical protein